MHHAGMLQRMVVVSISRGDRGKIKGNKVRDGSSETTLTTGLDNEQRGKHREVRPECRPVVHPVQWSL